MTETLDPASLDRFVGTLLAAGFEPIDGQQWVGPIDAALESMTAATTMTVRVYDGWPFHPPAVFVKGLPLGRHRNSHGHVCLWESGDPSLEWLTWGGVSERITKWAREAQGHPTADDPGMDPHLIFKGPLRGLATIDLTGRPVEKWDIGDIKAKQKDWGLEIGEGEKRGRWYVIDHPPTMPQTLSDIEAVLQPPQKEDLGVALGSVVQPDGVSFLVFAWQTPVGPNLLVLGLTQAAGGELEVKPYEAARRDKEVLLLRAGPDAATLLRSTVAIFGLGAVGSHVADLLARSGTGGLSIFDPERLRPGDVVRHAAGGIMVGMTKSDAVSLMNFVNAPWTDTKKFATAVWDPNLIGVVAEASDLVIDATGMSNFTAQLSAVCETRHRALVTVALYRQGRIGRARYQASETLVPIIDRPNVDRFPVIPPGIDEDSASWEAGCMAPAAQAPPLSVVAVGVSATRIAIDHLMDRDRTDRDVLEVFEPIGPAPFDLAGTVVIQ